MSVVDRYETAVIVDEPCTGQRFCVLHNTSGNRCFLLRLTPLGGWEPYDGGLVRWLKGFIPQRVKPPEDPVLEELEASFRALANAMRRQQWMLVRQRMERFERNLRRVTALYGDNASAMLFEAGILDEPRGEEVPL